MLEIIFIILLMGILAKVGSSFIPNNKLLNDMNYVSMKIKEAQKNAIGYDFFAWGNAMFWDTNRSDFNRSCITCNKTFFESLDHNFTLNATHVEGSITSFCFDAMGRPYVQGKLLVVPVDINISYQTKSVTISIMPLSGYVLTK